jgi:chromosome segregation ATPase
MTTVEDLTDRIADLRAERERAEAAIGPVEAELIPAERRLEAAQERYDRAVRLRMRAQAAVADNPGPQSAASYEDAKAVLAVADGELQECLDRRNVLLTRRGDLRQRCRALETAIASAEAEIGKLRVQAACTQKTESGLMERLRGALR